jgi:uncharacterized protein YndB with AHSA1/START domain
MTVDHGVLLDCSRCDGHDVGSPDWWIRERARITAVIRDEVSRQIAATPDTVWSLVANVTRMAEWSPTVERVEWVGDASGPEIGARFRGHNRQSGVRWSRECVITTCEPGRELAFETVFRDAPSTRWQYRFEPSDGGTRATESYEVLSRRSPRPHSESG